MGWCCHRNRAAKPGRRAPAALDVQGAATSPDPSPVGKCFSVDLEQPLGGSISLASWGQRPNLLELPFGQVTSLSLYFLNNIMGIIMESTIRVVVKIKRDV